MNCKLSNSRNLLSRNYSTEPESSPYSGQISSSDGIESKNASNWEETKDESAAKSKLSDCLNYPKKSSSLAPTAKSQSVVPHIPLAKLGDISFLLQRNKLIKGLSLPDFLPSSRQSSSGTPAENFSQLKKKRAKMINYLKIII
ncbi:hypothetical protein TKK_0014078 [Trichogramma kaykai]